MKEKKTYIATPITEELLKTLEDDKSYFYHGYYGGGYKVGTYLKKFKESINYILIEQSLPSSVIPDNYLINKLLEKHLGKAYYHTGELHGSIKEIVLEYASQLQTKEEIVSVPVLGKDADGDENISWYHGNNVYNITRFEDGELHIVLTQKIGNGFIKFIEPQLQTTSPSFPSDTQKEEIVDEFIIALLAEFNKRGIDTTDWDGEESPETIIVDGVARILEDSIEELKKLEPNSEEIENLKLIRGYFGTHDKTTFEHSAYHILDTLIKRSLSYKEQTKNKGGKE